MSEFLELDTPFNGRSYDEMRQSLNPNIKYPLQLCGKCGRAHVDYDELKSCPYCGGI